ncbi:MAG: hypothetical protein ACO2PM_07040 [Pyrobaculum sp.]
MSEPSPYFQPYAELLKQRPGRFTAGPPQLLSQYGIQLEDWRLKPIATLHGLAEITGIPTLARWIQAIVQNRPIAEVEKEYFSRIAKELQEAGIGVSEEALRRRVEQASMHAAVAALPLAVPLSRAEAAMLAKSLGVGFGFVGGPTAIIRAEQGYKDEALKAFIEAGLAGTVLTDVAMALKGLAAAATPERLAAVRQAVQQKRGSAGLSDPEFNAFMDEIEEAIFMLKRGDTSKYDSLLRRFEEWQKKVEEFQKLYEARQKGPLSPEDEVHYTKLLREVSQIRDRYDLLKQYIEAARMSGLEAGARRAEFERHTIENLAHAAQDAPPGPPPKDLNQWLQRIDLDLLQKLVGDPKALARYARRFGVDEQTLAERAALFLKERRWEKFAELPPEELKKVLMDESLLKKYASELGVEEGKLRALIEDALQRRMGIKPPEPLPTPEKPPIEPVKPAKEHQFKPPEVEVEGRGGQVLVVKAEEELRPLIRRIEELPDVRNRLMVLLARRRRGRGDEADLQRLREEAAQDVVERTPGRVRDDAEVVPDRTTPSKTTDEAPGRTTEGVPDQTTVVTPTKTVEREVQKVTEKVREVVVLDRDAIRIIVPALPAPIFAMPATVVLPVISRMLGMPVALAPGIPRPLPRETFGAWLDRVFAGTGFTWRSVAAQRETFVFA